MSVNWRRGWPREEIKEFGADVRELRIKSGAFSSLCTSEVYTLKLHLLGHFVEDARIFWTIFVLNTFSMNSLTFIAKKQSEHRLRDEQLVSRRKICL